MQQSVARLSAALIVVLGLAFGSATVGAADGDRARALSNMPVLVAFQPCTSAAAMAEGRDTICRTG